jgi:hypothetical protein
MIPLTDDPRFRAMLALLAAGDYAEASDLCEELFFEAVRDEIAFVRVFLQLTVGLHHLELRQWRPAAERLEEGIVAIREVTNPRGFDLVALAVDIAATARLARLRDAAAHIAALRCVQNVSAHRAQDSEEAGGAEEGEEGGAPGELLPAAEVERGGDGAEEESDDDRAEELGEPAG